MKIGVKMSKWSEQATQGWPAGPAPGRLASPLAGWPTYRLNSDTSACQVTTTDFQSESHTLKQEGGASDAQVARERSVAWPVGRPAQPMTLPPTYYLYKYPFPWNRPKITINRPLESSGKRRGEVKLAKPKCNLFLSW